MNTGKNRSARFGNNRSLYCLYCFIEITGITGENHFYTDLLGIMTIILFIKR